MSVKFSFPLLFIYFYLSISSCSGLAGNDMATARADATHGGGAMGEYSKDDAAVGRWQGDGERHRDSTSSLAEAAQQRTTGVVKVSARDNVTCDSSNTGDSSASVTRLGNFAPCSFYPNGVFGDGACGYLRQALAHIPAYVALPFPFLRAQASKLTGGPAGPVATAGGGGGAQ